MKMLNKKISLILFLIVGLWTGPLAAAELKGATLMTQNVTTKYLSLFLVTGRQGISNSFVVNKVYDKLGTYKVGGDIEIAPREMPRDGWRRPSHLLVVTHNQPELALNKFNIMGVSSFEKPQYFSEKDYIAPTDANTRFIIRTGILISVLNVKKQWEL